jgi:hypothetical protein
VKGLPKGATAQHVELDGYRNGWEINGTGDLNLTLEYAPAKLGRDASYVSQLCGYVLVVSLLLPLGSRRRRARRGRSAQAPK